MKWILIFIIPLLVVPARAENAAERIIEEIDLSEWREFAQENCANLDSEALLSDLLRGKALDGGEILAYLVDAAKEPLERVFLNIRGVIGPVLLLGLLRLAFSGRAHGSAGFLLRMILLLALSDLAMEAFDAVEKCLSTVHSFAEKAAPPLTAIMTILGKRTVAGALSPAAALVGSAVENLFLSVGMRLCRLALCVSIAGNLGESLDLSRTTRLLRHGVNWGTGMAITLFTGLIAAQGSVLGAADGLTMRTMKYAVDSASPIIGNGISDAWENYVAGILLAKNALGFSGIAILFAVGLHPVLVCLASMLGIQLLCALLDALGEKACAKACGEIAESCRMALSLCTGGLVIGMVLLGAVMAVAR